MTIKKTIAAYILAAVLTITGTGIAQTSTVSAAATDVRSVCGSGMTWSLYTSKYAKNTSGKAVGWLAVYKSGMYMCAIHYNLTGVQQFATAGILEHTSAGKVAEDKYDFGNFYRYAGPVRVYWNKSSGNYLYIYGQIGNTFVSMTLR